MQSRIHDRLYPNSAKSNDFEIHEKSWDQGSTGYKQPKTIKLDDYFRLELLRPLYQEPTDYNFYGPIEFFMIDPRLELINDVGSVINIYL